MTATIYPEGIDGSEELPDVIDNSTPISAESVNRLKDAIIAIESELGIKPSGIYTTVKLRLDNIEAVLEALYESGGGSLPVGPAGGDLSGTFPNPTVSKLKGRAISSTSPSVGQVLGWDGYEWIPMAVTASPALEITSFNGTTSVEAGQTVTKPSFTASYNQSIVSATLTDSEGTSPKDVTFNSTNFFSDASFTKTNYGQSVTFTLSAETSSSSEDSETLTITWLQKVYYGIGDPGENSESFIKSLTGVLANTKNRSFNVNATSGKKIYYAYRTGYGAATFSVGGFEGGFTLVSTSISVTNSYGVTEDYTLYESDNEGLGSTTVTVS